jgi:hypothetical protein
MCGGVQSGGVPEMKFLALVIFMMSCTPANADAIDGDWCAGGKRLSINGEQIVTPSGVTVEGTYRRHEYIFVVPKGEADAGAQIYLNLISDDEMNYYRLTNGKPGEPVLWKRCQITS